jgi:predicted O-linked N-acetylglucosamine transferase (SPINDLY family)
VLAQQQGRMPEAIEWLSRASEAAPGSAEIAQKLGTAAMMGGDSERAVAAFARAGESDPNLVEAPLSLGMIELSRGRVARALAALDRAERALGDGSDRSALAIQVFMTRGRALDALGRVTDAADCFGRAAKLDPTNAETAMLLGNALLAAGQAGLAADAFARAAELQPALVQAWYNLGTVRLNQARLDEAVEHLRRAFATIPEDGHADAKLAAIVQFNLGKALFAHGQVEDAIAAYGEAARFDPDFAKAEQTRLQVLLLRPEWDGPSILDARRRWSARFADPLTGASPGHGNLRERDRRLRIGYVGGEMFYGNTHARMVLPLLQAHDRDGIELFCYSDLAADDADGATSAYRAVADHWRIGHGIDDAALADRVRADNIDILVDLTGHLTGARLMTFAARPAPVQVTILATGTTGMAAFDATVADSWLVPPEHESHFSERVMRAPLAYHYRPEPDIPSPSPPPCLARGHVTFGSFNQVAKLSEPAVSAWARILVAVPNARLVLKSLGLADSDAGKRLRDGFVRRGIGADRIELRSWTGTTAAHQAAFADIDIALDTFPYAGANTTCESLWLGVPVITLAGTRLAGRFGVMLLNAIGYPEGIAVDVDDYIRRAVRLAGDRDTLSRLRTELPRRFRGSALTDSAAYARGMETAYRALWRNWCDADSR